MNHITVCTTRVIRVQRLGFISFETPKIRAWACSSKSIGSHAIQGHVHGSMLEFDVDTPYAEIDTAIRDRVAEMQRMYDQ